MVIVSLSLMIFFVPQLIVFCFFELSQEDRINAFWRKTVDTKHLRKKLIWLGLPAWIGAMLLSSKSMLLGGPEYKDRNYKADMQIEMQQCHKKLQY